MPITQVSGETEDERGGVMVVGVKDGDAVPSWGWWWLW